MLHSDVPIVERLGLVSLLNRIVRLLPRLEEDVGEAARHLRVVVLNHVHVQDGAKLRKVLPKLIFCGSSRDTSNIDITVILGVYSIALMIMDHLLTLLVMVVSLMS
mmetsp:Transcript_5348/g.7161  ORF Transcript_5348/g.7161 Transcript_5348/m.7161 type:complete len:106 (-) Transcript_5348:597-914(-)